MALCEARHACDTSSTVYWLHQYSLQTLSASPRRSSGVMPRGADEPAEDVSDTETEQLWRWGSDGPRTGAAAGCGGGGGSGCDEEEAAGLAKSTCGGCRCWSGAGDCRRATSSTSWLRVMVLAKLADRQWRCVLGRSSTVVLVAVVVVVVVVEMLLVLVLVLVLILSLEGGMESALTKRTAAASCREMPRALRGGRGAEHVSGKAGQAAANGSARLREISRTCMRGVVEMGGCWTGGASTHPATVSWSAKAVVARRKARW